jgi:hypothetical protein
LTSPVNTGQSWVRLAKNAVVTTRLFTHKQGMADFQRTVNPRLTGICYFITVSPFRLQLPCITIQNLMQA